jgi:hypothetical protein
VATLTTGNLDLPFVPLIPIPPYNFLLQLCPAKPTIEYRFQQLHNGQKKNEKAKT